MKTKLYNIKVYTYDSIGRDLIDTFYDLSCKQMLKIIKREYKLGAHKIDTLIKSNI